MNQEVVRAVAAEVFRETRWEWWKTAQAAMEIEWVLRAYETVGR